MQNQPIYKKEKKKLNATALLVVAVILLITASVGIIFWYFFVSKDVDNRQATNTDQAEELQELLAKVGRLIHLPTDEDPLVATVDNADKLKTEQPFYADVEQGDKLIIYYNKAQAIIYRPSEDKLINVGPIISNDSESAESESFTTLE